MIFSAVAEHVSLKLVFQKGPMDILLRTIHKEGFFALYKGPSYVHS